MSGVFSLNTAGLESTDTSPEMREKRVENILTRVRHACKEGQVVCLQEVHESWLEKFTSTFEEEGYKTISCLSNKRIDVHLMTAVPATVEFKEEKIEIPEGSDQFALVITFDNTTFANVHFAVRKDFRIAHTEALIRSLSSLPEKKIVIGDMNLMGDWGGFDQLNMFHKADFIDLTEKEHVADSTRTEMKWFRPYKNDSILEKDNFGEIVQKSIMLDAAMVFGFKPETLFHVSTGFLPEHASDHPGILVTWV